MNEEMPPPPHLFFFFLFYLCECNFLLLLLLSTRRGLLRHVKLLPVVYARDSTSSLLFLVETFTFYIKFLSLFETPGGHIESKTTRQYSHHQMSLRLKEKI